MVYPDDATIPIAVVGLSGRFPGQAKNAEKLWEMCAAGENAWSPFPSDRFSSEAFYHPDSGRNGSNNVRGGFFLKEDLAYFDGPFFGLNAAEAAALDPLQRLLLECSYEALEDAGIRIEDVAGKNIGVFIGTFGKEWWHITAEDPDAIPMYWATGGGHAMLSNRLSYFYDLVGPSLTVDTACSASLVACHLACQSLRAGECSSAIVGGVNYMLDPNGFATLSSAGFLSPDGRCHSFDQRANGYGRGEGAGCVVLKRLDDALKEGDIIRAIIRNTGINQDGKTPGVTFPSAKAQESLARKVYMEAGLDPLETTYVESHGTGTQAGDPVEASALFAAFGKGRSEPMQIGSVKSNVGHLEGASGVTGLIKTILMLEREQILPNSGFQTPNKRIPLEKWNLQVPTKCFPWTRKNGILRASVNSFAFGGTNAHVIVDDARGYLKARELPRYSKAITPVESAMTDPEDFAANSAPSSIISSEDGSLGKISTPDTSEASHAGSRDVDFKDYVDAAYVSLHAKSRLYVLSAYDEVAGKQYLKDMVDHLEKGTGSEDGSFMRRLADTMSSHRSLLPWKTSIVASSLPQMISSLQQANFTHSTKSPRVGFVFTGQGAQWHAMARSLLENKVFRKSLGASNVILESLGAEWSALEELQKDKSSSRVNETALSQPLCTIIQIALVDLLSSWCVVPTAVVGHSSGEIAAAYASGALSLKEAVTTAYYRGLIVGNNKRSNGHLKGAMAAVRATQSDVLAVLTQLQSGEAHIACHNSLRSFTVSGDEPTIDELIELCAARDIWARKLLVSIAYHSPKMEVFAEEYRTVLLTASNDSGPQKPSCEQYSSVTGRKLQSNDISPDYWVENMTKPVLFSDALLEMCTKSRGRTSTKAKNISSIDLLIEIGPHGALGGPVRELIQSQPALSKVSYLSALSREEDAIETVLRLASRLFDRGYAVDVQAVNEAADREHLVRLKLPVYPFNRSTRYWAEPRVHVDYRLRKWPRHDLLGAPVKFLNALEPRWRNWIRLAELPWLRDHRVQSLVIYPAAGYICMAIEAIRQHALETKTAVYGYDLRQISISQALVIPEPSGQVETMLCLKPYPENSRSSSGIWHEFFIYSASATGEWVEHCRGQISIRQPSLLNDVDGERQKKMARSTYAHQKSEADLQCTHAVDVPELYAQCAKIGLEYGPTFANMTVARVSEARKNLNYSRSVGTVSHPDIQNVMPVHHHSPFVVHPATLDAFFHVGIAGMTVKAVAIPTFISSVFVSDKLSAIPQHKFSVYAKIDNRGDRNSNFSVDVYDSNIDTDVPSLQVHGLESTFLSGQQGDQSISEPRKSYYRTRLRPDISSLSPSQFSVLCGSLQPKGEHSRIAALIDEAFYYMAASAIRHIPETAKSTLSSKGSKLYRSFQRIVEYVASGKHHVDISGWITKNDLERQVVLDLVRNSGDEGNFAVSVGEQFQGIISGTVDPLTLTLKDDILGRYYATNPRMSIQWYVQTTSCSNYEQAAVLVDLLAHKNPHLRILEIGAGTGGATLPILTALGGMDSTKPPRFISYHVTDITTGFFEKLQQKTAAWGDLVGYQKLDIESDTDLHGVETERYDLVIAANVLHATANIRHTMRNVRKLLNLGGTLLMIELIPTEAGFINTFGVFDGWWVGEEKERENSPLMLEESWDQVLRDTGFSGLDFALPDALDVTIHQGTTMVSQATKATDQMGSDVIRSDQINAPNVDKIILVSTTPSTISDTNNIERHISKHLKLLGKSVEVANHGSLNSDGRICILLELEDSILKDMTEPGFETLKTLFSQSKGIIWVTRGSSSNPDLSLVSGLIRTLRIETGRPLVHLDLDPTSNVETSANAIARVYKNKFEKNDDESDWIERGGLILIPRHMEDDKTGIRIASRVGNSTPEIDAIPQVGLSLKLKIAQFGLLDTFYYDDDTHGLDSLPHDHIEIEVKATALNFRDVMTAMGQLESTELGCECSGVVSKVGSDVKSLAVGDRVMAIGDGIFSTYARLPEFAACKIPDDMSFEIAASIPVAYGTAYHSLKAARLSKEDTVLIHASTGALGQALIMMCQNVGARIFATVGTLEKKAFLKTQFGISEEDIFYSRDSSFKQGIMNATNGRGVDVIFNSLSSELQRVTWECIAPFGRFIELGRRDFVVNTRLEQAQFLNNTTFVGLDFRQMTMTSSRYSQEAFNGYMNLIRSGTLKAPQPISIYGRGEIEKAMRTMQRGEHIGKLVIVEKEGERAKMMPRKAPKIDLRGDATYVLVGGMGGIGRELAVKLVEWGAKNLAFLSRSGASAPAASALIKTLEGLGAAVKVVECDVGNTLQVEAAVKEITHQMAPIKGMFNLGMVLRSALFENMTLEDWTESLRPKVQGTWNLHNLLPKDLDFFVLMSSIVGINGNASQAAYAASSSFQDSFSAYRNRLGLPAITIDLGLVTGIGYVADRDILEDKLKTQGYEYIDPVECLAIIEEAISQPFEDDYSSNLITGFGLGKFTGGDIHHASHQNPQSSHARRLALSAFSRSTIIEESVASLRIRELLRVATSLDAAEEQVLEALRMKLSNLLMHPLDDIESSRPLSYYGLDSLVAVEMRNWIASEIEAAVPVLELLGSQSISDLSKSIARQSRILKKLLS